MKITDDMDKMLILSVVIIVISVFIEFVLLMFWSDVKVHITLAITAFVGVFDVVFAMIFAPELKGRGYYILFLACLGMFSGMVTALVRYIILSYVGA